MRMAVLPTMATKRRPIRSERAPTNGEMAAVARRLAVINHTQ
jgi:hypothetical protein